MGDGGTVWGSSTTPGYSIDQGVNDVDEATFRAIHLAPYETALEAGARIVMASFSGTGAGKVHGDRHLLTDVLKGELGFTGFVVSDWAGVDQVDPDYDAAVASAISAGIDMVMVPSDGPRFQAAVQAGLANGKIDPARIDDAVTRILHGQVRDGPVRAPDAPGGRRTGGLRRPPNARAGGGRQVGRCCSRPTAGLLPLATGDGEVLLAGSGADDIGTQSGGWTISWQGSTGPTTPGTTIADALRARIGDNLVDTGDRAIPAGTHARTGIVVVAEPPYAEGLGDSATLALPAADVATVAEVRPIVDRLIVVVLSGRPVMLDGILPTADAVVAAWLPGHRGCRRRRRAVRRPRRSRQPRHTPGRRRPNDAPRTGKDACDGAVFPLGYGLNADGSTRGTAACPGS